MDEPPEATRGLVLIVDDEAAIRFGVSEALSYAGYEVEAVGDGEEALQRIGARRFEAVLSDISMPGMDGVELLRRVRRDPGGRRGRAALPAEAGLAR